MRVRTDELLSRAEESMRTGKKLREDASALALQVSRAKARCSANKQVRKKRNAARRKKLRSD